MALILRQLKDYDAAMVYAQKCVDLVPEEMGYLILLAEIHMLAGDENAALAAYLRVLERVPNDSRIRMVVSTILIKKKRYNEALHHLDILIQNDPNLVIAHYYKGRVLIEQGKIGLAEQSFLNALELNEKMEPALLSLGSLYQMQQKYDLAVEIYEQILGFYPSNSVIQERLINLYYELGQKDKAERLTDELKKQSEPGDPGRQALGLIYLRHGKLKESIAELELIVSAWPEDEKSRYYLAIAYQENGQLEDALEQFGQIKETSSLFSNARLQMAYIWSGQKKYEQAIGVLKKAIEVEQGNIDLYLLAANVYEAQEEYQKAIDMTRMGLVHDAENVRLLFRLGVILDKMGQKDACLIEMRRILEIDADNADALNYIGYTYAEQGIRLDEAMELVQRALRIKPDSGYIIDSLGWIYFQKGLYDEAAKILERAASLTPDDPTIREHLGDVYFKKGDFKKSLDMYRMALTLDHPKADMINEKIEAVKKVMEKGQEEK
jgi:tetratricopeptide (TPR) repeat protein